MIDSQEAYAHAESAQDEATCMHAYSEAHAQIIILIYSLPTNIIASLKSAAIIIHDGYIAYVLLTDLKLEIKSLTAFEYILVLLTVELAMFQHQTFLPDY